MSKIFSPIEERHDRIELIMPCIIQQIAANEHIKKVIIEYSNRIPSEVQFASIKYQCELSPSDTSIYMIVTVYNNYDSIEILLSAMKSSPSCIKWIEILCIDDRIPSSRPTDEYDTTLLTKMFPDGVEHVKIEELDLFIDSPLPNLISVYARTIYGRDCDYTIDQLFPNVVSWKSNMCISNFDYPPKYPKSLRHLIIDSKHFEGDNLEHIM